jgi:hypothetical protein
MRGSQAIHPAILFIFCYKNEWFILRVPKIINHKNAKPEGVEST